MIKNKALGILYIVVLGTLAMTLLAIDQGIREIKEVAKRHYDGKQL